MKKLLIPAFLSVLVAAGVHAQTTVATFDSPACSGNGLGT